MDNNSQLINYIVQELKRGVPESSIRDALLQSGWPIGPVDKAFVMLRQTDPPTTPASSGAELPPIQPEIQTPRAGSSNTLPSSPLAQKQRRSLRWLFIALLVAGLLAVAAYAILSFLDRPTSPKPVSRDTQRKNALNSLADELTVYYTTTGTYPTLTAINDPGFAASEGGFDATNYRDPTWKTDNTTCTNKDNKAILAEIRSKGCFAYRVTALNGDVCDAKHTKCTRVVLSANLTSDKPYIVALDQNKKE